MSANILGQGLHADVYAMGESVEKDARCIGVVNRDRHIARMRCCNDSRHTLHLHRHRAWTLCPHQSSIISNERGDVRSDQWVVTFDLYVESLQQSGCELTVRAIGRKRNESVTSCLAE